MVTCPPFVLLVQFYCDTHNSLSRMEHGSAADRLGIRPRRLGSSKRRSLPRCDRRWRLLGIYRGEVPFHFVRHFSRRPALAAGLGHRNTAGALSAQRLTQHETLAPRLLLVSRSGSDRRTHVGRSVWLELR